MSPTPPSTSTPSTFTELTVASGLKSLATLNEAIQPPSVPHLLSAWILVSQASAGVASEATMPRPRIAPPRTVEPRRRLVVNRFTPTPVLGFRCGEEAAGRRRNGGEAVDDASPRRRHAAVTTCNGARP